MENGSIYAEVSHPPIQPLSTFIPGNFTGGLQHNTGETNLLDLSVDTNLKKVREKKCS